MNKLKPTLPMVLTADSLGLELTAITRQDMSLYQNIYCNEQLMKYISGKIDKDKVLNGFKALLAEHNKPEPAYISYVVKHELESLGIVGIKILSFNEIEIGVIIQQQHQKNNWSRKIKLMLIDIIFSRLKAEKIVTYCHQKNAAVNHINQSIGFILSKQFPHKTRNYQMNKWVLESSQYIARK